jgi:hypothetical protein
MIIDIQEAIEQVNYRNALRASSGLPLLRPGDAVCETIQRDRRFTEDALWVRFSDQVGNRIFDKALAKARLGRNNPIWTPRASLYNGNWNFFHEVQRRKERLFRRLYRGELADIEKNYAQLGWGLICT